ncbi:hypothetical protein GDO78_014752 [Eleutherodactylus coqui]|uniref:Uncharacterized protein n=1 Tax=Eleutherodactylus coqui TaxID=57060 RepID=A0A8J6E6X3_ELECQ|nr:hypothetical protein GDO78_014752 [Eleutherodactylus coqui]
MVVTCTIQPGLARDPCSSFNIAAGLLTAPWLVFSSIFQGRPVLGNITTVPNLIHFLIMSSLCSMVYVMPWKCFGPLLMTDTFQ